MKNINTKSYWDARFDSGDWEQKNGRNQTELFAKSQIPKFSIAENFLGTILDFGCGLGDSFPVYRQKYPYAKLIGMDISETAIEKCKKKFNHIADFICGDYLVTPKADVIIASNVFEHLSNDLQIATELYNRCKTLYIIVPYKEDLIPDNEHINSYNTSSFESIPGKTSVIFRSKGWSEFGFDLFFNVHLKNIARFVLGKKIRKVRKQILFRFESTHY